MPKCKKYIDKIPAFYRRDTLDILLFAHVTAMKERGGMTIQSAIDDFFELYGFDEDDYPMESALVTYNRIYHNFVYTKIKS